MAPAKWRGTLNTAFQLFIGAGVVLAALINLIAAHLGDIGWRVSLGCAAIPAAIMTVGAMFIPDTPSSLIQRGRVQKARQSLQQVRGVDSDTEAELNEMINHNEAAKADNRQPYKVLFERRHRPHLVLATAIPSFQQFTGINVIAFYAPVMFRSIGVSRDGALIAAVILNFVNAASTLVSTFAVDKFGRRLLFFEAGVQMIACQVS